MKKLIYIFTILLFSGTAAAKVWTVENNGKTADFTSLTSAVNGASSTDTLLIGGSATAYNNVALTKKLCMIGTGYFLTENPNTIEYKSTVLISSFTFSSGSEGSEIIGLNIAGLNVSTDNITVRRCYISTLVVSGNNNKIKQNYLNGGSYNFTGSGNTIRNNFFYAGSFTVSTSNTIENNVFQSIALNITSSAFGNNIQHSGTATFSTCNPYNNIGQDNQFGTLNGNQSYITMSTVFVASGTSDGKWQLSSVSPAKGAGLGGIDCGMYGGNDPYVLSGIPDIPLITSITVPARATPTNGLNIQLNVRSNK